MMKTTKTDSIVQERGKRLWKRAVLWLLFLGPFFFISYGFSNWLASQRAEVTHFVFDWEQYIPFVPWTIIPYWIIDVLYAISLFICTTKKELDSHAKRLLTVQVIAVTCFVLFPLEFSFERPDANGFIGGLFAILSSFDQPFNQAPSLHIALLVILWVLYVSHLPRILVWPFHILCFLIGISVLTTYQHHFIDVPTGALLGWFSIWLWPKDGRTMLRFSSLEYLQRRWCLAAYFLLGAIVFTILALGIGGGALWLLWPATSMLLVAIFYAFIGSEGFQKNADGKMNLAVKWLLFPYLLGARVNSRIWTRKDRAADHIDAGVWLGRFPSRNDIEKNKYNAVVDLTAEFVAPESTVNWYSVPNLDLLTPSDKNLMEAAELIERLKGDGPILVSCALGYSRSAMAVIAWLLTTNRAKNIDTAIVMVKKKRPSIVLKNTDRKVLAGLIQ